MGRVRILDRVHAILSPRSVLPRVVTLPTIPYSRYPIYLPSRTPSLLYITPSHSALSSLSPPILRLRLYLAPFHHILHIHFLSHRILTFILYLLHLTQPYSTVLNRTLQISIELKLLWGAYTLQSNRPACNQTGVKPICQMCCSDEETLEHFVWYCSALDYTRNSVLSDISHEVASLLNKPYFSDLTDDEKLQIILDCTDWLINRTENFR